MCHWAGGFILEATSSSRHLRGAFDLSLLYFALLPLFLLWEKRTLKYKERRMLCKKFPGLLGRFLGKPV